MNRTCNVVAAVSFPPPIPECDKLAQTRIYCIDNGRLRLAYTVNGISGQNANSTLKVSLSNGSLTSPSAGGTLAGTNTINYSLGAPTNGIYSIDFILVPSAPGAVSTLTFELKSANGLIICASSQVIRPQNSLCLSPNRCNKFTVETEPTIIMPGTTNVIYSNFKIVPASQGVITSYVVSVVNVERRVECPNQAPSAWETVMSGNSPMVVPNNTTSGSAATSQPLPNSVTVTNNPQLNFGNGSDHTLTLRGLPEKKNASCPESLRFTLRYIVRNNQGCEVEFYRISEVVR